jgi:hypothetical protein
MKTKGSRTSGGRGRATPTASSLYGIGWRLGVRGVGSRTMVNYEQTV